MQYFNPRLREGGDNHKPSILRRIKHFNPRLREGGDVINTVLAPLRVYFNPRLREGGDKNVMLFSCLLRISIHASAREATETA